MRTRSWKWAHDTVATSGSGRIRAAAIPACIGRRCASVASAGFWLLFGVGNRRHRRPVYIREPAAQESLHVWHTCRGPARDQRVDAPVSRPARMSGCRPIPSLWRPISARHLTQVLLRRAPPIRPLRTLADETPRRRGSLDSGCRTSDSRPRRPQAIELLDETRAASQRHLSWKHRRPRDCRLQLVDHSPALP